MQKYIIILGVSLLLFSFVKDWNDNAKRAKESREKEISINYMWIQQLRSGTDIASRTKREDK